MERVFVQLGVNVCGLQEAMSEHVSHLLEAGATPDHSSGGCVPEGMRAQPADGDPREFEMPFGDATDGTATSNRAERRAGTQENERLSALWPTVSQVFRQSLANVTWQGQPSCTRRFRRMDSKLPLSPIDIRQPKTGDFSSP